MEVQDYTWLQFVTEVKELLPIDAGRKGLGSTEYLNRLIRQGVIQLQGVIDGYRIGHETIYNPSDFVQEGYALRGVKPPQSAIRDVFYVKTIDPAPDGYNADLPVIRFNCRTYPWAKRFNLVNRYEHVDGRAIFCADPYGYTFYLYPAPCDGAEWRLSMNWDGLKLDFQDDEQTPFDEQMAGAIAYWVKMHVALEIEEDGEKHKHYKELWMGAKPLLAVHQKELAAVKY